MKKAFHLQWEPKALYKRLVPAGNHILPDNPEMTPDSPDNPDSKAISLLRNQCSFYVEKTDFSITFVSGMTGNPGVSGISGRCAATEEGGADLKKAFHLQ